MSIPSCILITGFSGHDNHFSTIMITLRTQSYVILITNVYFAYRDS